MSSPITFDQPLDIVIFALWYLPCDLSGANPDILGETAVVYDGKPVCVFRVPIEICAVPSS